MKVSRFLVAALISGGACSSSTDPDPDWFTKGSVVARDMRIPIGEAPSIHVREMGEECGVIFLVRPSTEITYRRDGGIARTATYDDLALGTRVKVWTRIILESCPAQAGAERIEIQD